MINKAFSKPSRATHEMRGADLLKLCRLKLDKISKKTSGLHDCERAGLNKMKNEKWRINNYFKRKNYSLFIINYKFKRAVAFTLAEVLITLGVIGVVAAVAMPSMITNITERRNSERQANIAYKITQAMEHMRATGTLVTYDSTESFVNELQKHLKIAKVCDKDHLTECWPTEKVIGSDGKEYNVADAKTGPKLGINTKTNNVGIVLADGAPLILNYDNTTQGFDIGTPVRASNIDLPVGNGKTKTFAYTTSVTGAIDFVTDVNGKGKPNREYDSKSKKYYDIRSFKSAGFSKAWECDSEGKNCISYLGTSYDPVDCSNSSSDDYDKYCGPHPSRYSNDYWAGAKKACVQKGMHLPEIGELETIYQKRGEYPSLSSQSDWFRSATEDHSGYPQYCGMGILFTSGNTDYDEKNEQYKIVCAAD